MGKRPSFIALLQGISIEDGGYCVISAESCFTLAPIPFFVYVFIQWLYGQ